MSSINNEMNCPNCGYPYARYTQDNVSCDTYEFCKRCKYSMENGIVTNKGRSKKNWDKSCL